MTDPYEIQKRLRENPLPENGGEFSDLIQGLFYYYGIDCREDEWLAENFWQGNIPTRLMKREAGHFKRNVQNPETVLRLALMYNPGGDSSRKKRQEQFLNQLAVDLPMKAYLDIMEGLPCTWQGYDPKDPRPEDILKQADETYQEADFTDWKKNMDPSGGIIPGTCFTIYEAAERMYRLAAIGGNLRALEVDIPEIEYYYEQEFQEEIWEKIARAVRRTQDYAADLQSRGDLKEAARWWEKSASGGNPSSMKGLIICLEQWEDAPNRDQRLVYWRGRLVGHHQ